MIIRIETPCQCGNENPEDFVEYDGALGYEAIICRDCGRYSDLEGMHEADEFSRQYLTK